MDQLHFCALPRRAAKDRGIKRYFTGKPCKHGHLVERFASDGKCVECRRLRREKNSDAKREYARRWRKDNPDYYRQYIQQNPEKTIARLARRRAAKIDRALSCKEDLTQFVIQEAAKQSRDMEEAFGMPFHVDHMIPMRGRDVSGLHVWYNIQVIPAPLNFSKSNRMLYTEDLEWLADAARVT